MPKTAGMQDLERKALSHSAVCEEVCNSGKLWCERWSRGMHRTCEIYVAWMADNGSEIVRNSDDVSHLR
jgi:hypothetical protein